MLTLNPYENTATHLNAHIFTIIRFLIMELKSNYSMGFILGELLSGPMHTPSVRWGTSCC